MPSFRTWLLRPRTFVARVGVGLAAVFGLLGLLITFYPGVEAGWFAVAANTGLRHSVRMRRRRLAIYHESMQE